MVASLIRLFLIVIIVVLTAANGEEPKSSPKGGKEEDGNFVLYTDIKPANRTDSLVRLRNVPFVRYKFKYDSVVDRTQMGIIGPEAQKYFPESIEVVPSQTFSSKDRSKPATVITNFPAVDKNVLFMHGLVVLQELIYRYEELSDIVDAGDEAATKLKEALKEIDDRIHKDVSFHAEEKLSIARMEAELVEKQLELESQKLKDEEEILERQMVEEKKILDYESELARERMNRQEELAKKNADEALQMERELAEKKELLSRETDKELEKIRQNQAKELEQKKLDHEKEKIRLEIEAKASQQKAVQEMELRKMEAKSKLDTQRMVTGIQTVSKQISSITAEVLSRPTQVAMIVGIVLGLISVYYLFKEISKLLRQYIQTRLGRPSLIRETSYEWSVLPHFISNWFSPREDLHRSRKQLEREFANIILSDSDKERVLSLALATRNTRQSGAPYRHVLLHGSPGTGKTLIARRLALSSGMDYAVMSGGDVGPLGEDAVNQLHGLFQWANRSRKGLLVFIDEAEAFLSARTSRGGGTGGSEDASDVHIRNALNALLYQTGTPSHKFMLVLATNRPQDLDAAVLDRVDVSMPIAHPAVEQRMALVHLYMDMHLLRVAAQSQKQHSWLWAWFTQDKRRYVEDACRTEAAVGNYARLTEGFSGREIAKLFIAAQYAMFLAPERTLTEEMLCQTVLTKVEEHRLKCSGFAANNRSDTNVVPALVSRSAANASDSAVSSGACTGISSSMRSSKGKKATGGSKAQAQASSSEPLDADADATTAANASKSTKGTRGRTRARAY
mmetsp:Transcript_20217/g.34431  ORF Transcript_20217/g.34431 Transcript_20217/m.34431 type:complete len:791 (-) Transcript_20217:64-2436(-)